MGSSRIHRTVIRGPIASIAGHAVDNKFTIDDYIGMEVHWESLKSRS
jgi:hypothetical protein